MKKEKKSYKTCKNCQDYYGCLMIHKEEPKTICEHWKLDFAEWQKLTEGKSINEIEKMARELL